MGRMMDVIVRRHIYLQILQCNCPSDLELVDNVRGGAITYGVAITHVLHQYNNYLSNSPTTEKIETNKRIPVNSQSFLELKSGMREKYMSALHVRKS